MDGTTDLLWVQNTESDVFRLGRTGPVYYLVAGRWFSAPDFTGPVDVRDADAARRTSRRFRSSIRARACSPRCPGTPQAAEAVLLAQVPQTARVNKKELKAPEVDVPGRAEVRADREDARSRGR